MKKILAVILCLTFVLAAFGSMTVLADTATTAPEGGYTQNDDAKLFQVWTGEGLVAVKNLINKNHLLDYTITLMSNIDMSAFEWNTPIGAGRTNYFRGTFDGQGHTITGLHTGEGCATQALGLIGYARSGCVVKNVNLVGINYNNTKAYNGGLIGEIVAATEFGGEVIVENCTVTGKIATTDKYAGGIVGCMRSFEDDTVKVQETDADGKIVEKNVLYPPTLIVRNCAVNVTLFAAQGRAAGVFGGDAFTHNTLTPKGSYPIINVENVFVSGEYSSSADASGFIGYFDIVKVTLKNCYSAAELNGSPDFSGSFFGQVKKCNLTVENCYSLSDYPFAGEIENLGVFKDANDNIMDGLTILNSFAAQTAAGKAAKVCARLTIPMVDLVEPGDGADETEIKAYEDACAAHAAVIQKLNEMGIVNLNGRKKTIAEVANTTKLEQMKNSDGKLEARGYTTDINLTIDSVEKQRLLDTVQEKVLAMFAGNEAQLAIWNEYYEIANCEHEKTPVEKAEPRYIVKSASCIQKAEYYLSCPDCGMSYDETFKVGEYGDHVMSTGWRYADGGETHFHQCTVCTEYLEDEAPHSFGAWEVTRPATVTRVGKEVRTCSVCEAEQERDIPKLNPPKTEAPKAEEEGGCGSAIGGASIIIMLAAAGAVMLRKKED